MNNNRMRTLGLVLVVVLAIGLFAIPALAQDDDETPFLGVRVREADGGALVTQVIRGSAAADAGLERGDLITALDDDAVTAETLSELVSGYAVGDVVSLAVERDGEELTLEATLGTRQPSVLGGGIHVALGGPIAITINSEDGTLVIGTLSEDSPLYEAGLREGDVITAVNGEALDLDRGFGYGREFLRGFDGEVITLTVERDGESMDIDVDVEELDFPFMGMHMDGLDLDIPFFDGDMDIMPFGSGQHGFFFGGGQMRLGVSYVQLNASIAEERGVDVSEGALITGVITGSPAEMSGMQEGDVVLRVNGDVVDAERTLAERLAAYGEGDVVTLEVLRDGETVEVEVTVGQGESVTWQFGEHMENMMPFIEQHMQGMMPGFGEFFGGRDGMHSGDGRGFGFGFSTGGGRGGRIEIGPGMWFSDEDGGWHFSMEDLPQWLSELDIDVLPDVSTSASTTTY